jgi:FdhD protein
MNAEAGWQGLTATRRRGDGSHEQLVLDVADERPVAIAYHGVEHAVMMATPDDLEDFALGFTLAEAIALAPDDVRSIQTGERPTGELTLDITLSPARLHAFLAARRRRNRIGHGGCGVCGTEDFTKALPMPRPHPAPSAEPSPHAVLHALGALRGAQPLARRTRGAHAAAWAGPDGTLVLVREDVGRHNAMDKLLGAFARTDNDPREGFCVLTSRCSVELVQKAAIAGFGVLVCVSAPTTMAVRWADQAGLTLLAAVHDDAFTVFTGQDLARTS